jgi:coenzyme PQQ synthesis protein D (PqqD)
MGDQNMGTLAATLIPSADVQATIIDGEAVLLDLRTEQFLGLNETATRMWQYFQSGQTLEQTLQCLQSEFDATEEQLHQDLIAFVDDMVEKGLLNYR